MRRALAICAEREPCLQFALTGQNLDRDLGTTTHRQRLLLRRRARMAW